MDGYEHCGMYSGSQHVDAYTTTNNCSQGLDLRSTSRHDDAVPSTRAARNSPSAPAADDGCLNLETGCNKDLNLQSLVGSEVKKDRHECRPFSSNEYSWRTPSADKKEFVAQWCKDQREFTQSRTVTAEVCRRKPASRLSACDKLIKRITHPFTQRDQKRLEAMNGEIHSKPANGTLTDVQHTDFVQGLTLSCFYICVVNCLF